MKVKATKNSITLELTVEPYASASGKNIVLASTHGNQAIAVDIDGKPILLKVGVNIYATPADALAFTNKPQPVTKAS